MVFLTVSQHIWADQIMFNIVANEPEWKDFSDDTIEQIAKNRLYSLAKEKNSFEEIKTELAKLVDNIVKP